MPEIVYRFLLFALIHSLLAVQSVRKLICRTQTMSRFYRLVYNFVALVSFAWVVAALTHPGSPELYAVTGYPAVVLRGIQGGALIVLCYCAAQTGLGEFLGIRQILTGEESAPLITQKGCYRHVRHPQYALAVIVLLAAPTVTVDYALFTLLATIYFIVGSFIEEARMCQIFGDDYRRYQRDVPMFFPRPKIITTKPKGT